MQTARWNKERRLPSRRQRSGDRRSLNCTCSKAEEESFRAGSVTHRLSILSATGRTRCGGRANQFVTQIEPAAQLLRCLFDLTRPTAAHKRAFYFSEGTVLPQRQKCYASTFRERQLEIAMFRVADKHFADECHSRVAIKKLSTAHLPVASRFGELMRRGRRAAS